MTTGVLQIDRIPGITPEARQALTIRDVLTANPTQLQVVDFVKVSTPMSIASPVAENSTKPENAVTFTSASERVRTIATWIPATRQILDDFQELANFLNTSLSYYVDLEEELQLLSGDGSGENLNGLIPQATGFDTSRLSASAGWTKLDIIGRAIQQVTVAKEIPPTFVVLHPNDYWDIRLTKDGFGRYILGDPQIPVSRPQIFGLDLVPTTSIASGSFLVGSGNSAAAEIRDRMETIVEISTSHSDFFVKNLVAIRCEKRLALVVKRAASFITGTFTTSPA
jgi:HK97 family phage major capsid protein